MLLLELIAIVLLAGIALGLRYKVVILVPVVILVATFVMVVGIAYGGDFRSVALAMVAAGTAVQLGYLVGITISVVVG